MGDAAAAEEEEDDDMNGVVVKNEGDATAGTAPPPPPSIIIIIIVSRWCEVVGGPSSSMPEFHVGGVITVCEYECVCVYASYDSTTVAPMPSHSYVWCV
jgi:hypothetical protein